MPGMDEYDAYYSPIDPEDLVDIEAAALAAYALRESAPVPQTSQESQEEPASSDEFDSYDFSEFTAQDFEQIDALVLMQSPVPTPPAQRPSPRGRRRSQDEGGGRAGRNGGPRVEIAFERAKNANTRRRVKGSSRTTPFQQFRRWNGVLSVTDLVGPSWCEVQFDYGLRQKRHKKLEDRPSSFVTAQGKTITVVQDVATQNDRTVTRGKSVHKVLEREVQPETVPVDVTTPEERWGLRLINMLAALQTLAERGYCREMPVFGIVHDQVVTGIIDEIARKPVPVATQTERKARQAGTGSPNKRPAPGSVPATPSKSPSKKSKHAVPDGQPQITAFFSPGKRAETPTLADPPSSPTLLQEYMLHLSDTKTRTRPSLPPDEDTFASRMQLMLYHRLLSSLLSVGQPAALDLAALWERVGVDPTRRFSETFLTQAGLAPSSPSSDATAVGNMCCLDDLVVAWKHTVEALHVAAVDTTLTLVYRNQPMRRTRKKDRGGGATNIDQQEAQALAAAIQASVSDSAGDTDGDPDLARAIFESLKDALVKGKGAGGDVGVLAHPFGVPISEAPGSTTLESEGTLSRLSEDSEFAGAAQQSLLPPVEEKSLVTETASEESAPPAYEQREGDGVGSQSDTGKSAGTKPTVVTTEDPSASGSKTAPGSPLGDEEFAEVDEMMTAAELDVEAGIIGTKEFTLDDTLLDRYLTRVLAWWHGERPAEGVSVELTRRCVACEYREGCEWREKKAQEAMRKSRDHGETSQPDHENPSEWS